MAANATLSLAPQLSDTAPISANSSFAMLPFAMPSFTKPSFAAPDTFMHTNGQTFVPYVDPAYSSVFPNYNATTFMYNSTTAPQ